MLILTTLNCLFLKTLFDFKVERAFALAPVLSETIKAFAPRFPFTSINIYGLLLTL